MISTELVLTSKLQTAHKLVNHLFSIEPDLEEVYLILGGEDQPIRLIEINPASIERDRFEAFSFPPTPEYPYPILITEMTRSELDRVVLPPEWDLDSAVILKRPKG